MKSEHWVTTLISEDYASTQLIQTALVQLTSLSIPDWHCNWTESRLELISCDYAVMNDDELQAGDSHWRDLQRSLCIPTQETVLSQPGS